MNNLQFYNFKEFQSMPYIPYDNYQSSPIQYAPIQHIHMNSIQDCPRARPASIHPYANIIDNPYLDRRRFETGQGPVIKSSLGQSHEEFKRDNVPFEFFNGIIQQKIKIKRNVSWKKENLVGVTFSKDDYDRTIDSLQIRKNIQDIRQYHLAKLQPLTRQPSVSEDLFDMDLEREDIR